MSRTSHIWRWFTAALITAMVLLGSGRTVSAHADLLRSNPAADSMLDTSPAEIVLTFMFLIIILVPVLSSCHFLQFTLFPHTQNAIDGLLS